MKPRRNVFGFKPRLICTLIGHDFAQDKIEHAAVRYYTVEPDATDGIGRRHGRLYAYCDRCWMQVRIGMVHIPERFNPARVAE